MPDSLLRGKLGTIGLSSVFYMLESDMVTGRLEVAGGSFEFNDGVLQGATFGPHTGRTAIRAAFLDEKGGFELIEDDVEQADSLGPITALIMDACRLSDEWARLRTLKLERTGVDDGVVVPTSIERLWASLDGTRPIAHVVRLTQSDPVLVTDALLAMLESGHLRQVGAPADQDELWAFDDVESIDDLVATGRRALKERDFESALLAFEAAVMREPDNRTLHQNLRRIKTLQRQENAL